MPWIAALIVGGISLYSGYKQKKAYEQGGDMAQEVAYLNAADLRQLALFNSAGYRQAGDINANAILTIGEANAIAVENATSRNMLMYGMQSQEDRRRHILQERMTAGSIRAVAGGSGIQVNTGSPLRYLHSQVDLGIRERRYGDIKSYWTLRNMFEEGTERASVIRLTADQQAMVTRYNAELQAEMSYLEAMRQAQAMERGGDAQQAVGSANGSAAMWGGVSNAISSGLGVYNAFGGSFGWLQPSGAGPTTSGAYGYSGSTYSNASNPWGYSSSYNPVGMGPQGYGMYNTPYSGATQYASMGS